MALADQFRAFIFDYGGVLVQFQPPAEQERLASLAGIPKELFHKLYWEYRLSYDRGLLSHFDYWQTLAAAAGKRFSSETVEELTEADIQSWLHFNPAWWEWAHKLRQSGKRVALLSNMPRELGEALRSRTDRLKRFDHVALSYETGLVKPDAAAFEACLRNLGVQPGEAVFFDDSIVNVEGAEKLGIRGIHVDHQRGQLESIQAS